MALLKKGPNETRGCGPLPSRLPSRVHADPKPDDAAGIPIQQKRTSQTVLPAQAATGQRVQQSLEPFKHMGR